MRNIVIPIIGALVLAASVLVLIYLGVFGIR